MPIITLLVVLVVVGFLLWLANTYIPMQPTVRKIVNFVAILLIVLWLLNVFGILGTLQSATV